MAVTVRQFELSSRVCNRFKPPMLALLLFWKMDPWLVGVVGVKVWQFPLNSRACSRFRAQVRSSLRLWQMDPSLPGVVDAMVVTVRQFNMNSGLFSSVVDAEWRGQLDFPK